MSSDQTGPLPFASRGINRRCSSFQGAVYPLGQLFKFPEPLLFSRIFEDGSLFGGGDAGACDAGGKAKAGLHEIWQAETQAQAEKAFDRFIHDFGAKYPKAVEKLVRDRTAHAPLDR